MEAAPPPRYPRTPTTGANSTGQRRPADTDVPNPDRQAISSAQTGLRTLGTLSKPPAPGDLHEHRQTPPQDRHCRTVRPLPPPPSDRRKLGHRSEEHTSELQSP